MKTLPQNLQKIIDDYKNNLQNFISEHNLESELISDIDERIYEKISEIKNPKSSDIANILAEIGTPEEIFSEELQENTIAKNSNNEKQKNIFQKIKEKNEGMIFLGVFKAIADILNISVFWVRVITCFFLLLLLPATNGVIIPIFLFAYFLAFLILKTRVFSFLFFLGLSVLFGFIFFGSLIVFLAFISDFNYANMYIFHDLNLIFPIGLTIGVISLAMLFIYFIAKTFRKNISVYWLVSGIILFIIGIASGVVFVIDMRMKYSREELVSQTISLPAQKDKILNFHFAPRGSYDAFGFGYSDFVMHETITEPSNSENIEFSIKTEHHGSSDIIEKSKKFIKNIDITFDENRHMNMDIRYNVNTEEKFPLLFIRSDIDVIKVPVGQKFRRTLGDMQGGLFVKFPNYQNYNYADIIRVSNSCSVVYYDENKELNCSFESGQENGSVISEKIFAPSELRRLQSSCERYNAQHEEKINCDFMESEMKKTQEFCQKKQNRYYYQCGEIMDNENKNDTDDQVE